MKRTKALTLFIWTVIIVTCILLLAAQLSGLAAIAGVQVDPEQLRMVLFIPLLLDQCGSSYDCAVVEPTPQPECDLKNWWECP